MPAIARFWYTLCLLCLAVGVIGALQPHPSYLTLGILAFVGWMFQIAGQKTDVRTPEGQRRDH